MSSYQENADFVAILDANRVQDEMLKTVLLRALSNSDQITEIQAARRAVSLPGWAQQQQQQQQQPSYLSHPFQKTFEDELRRVTKFVNAQQEGLELSAKALFLQAMDALATIHNNTGISGLSSSSSVQQESYYATIADLKRSTRKHVDDCLALQDFFTASRTSLLENAWNADQKLGQVVNCSSLVSSLKAHLNSSLVCVISDIYNALKQAEKSILNNQNNNGGAGDQLWQAPSSFERTTTKYWVKDENLTKLMMTCAMEAPLLVYGKKGPLTSTNRKDAKKSDGDKLWDTLATRITSIYFDSNDMSLYRERLKRAEGAQLLRARWYGPTMPTGDKIIFVELKTHHEKWVAQKSVKERANVLERDMVQFLTPVPWKREVAEEMILRAKPNMKEPKKADELKKATGLLLRMHNLVVNHKLTACVRSVYDRAAFQSSTSNDLRLTLDRTVTLVNEREKQFSDGQWCLSDSEAQTARASVVPYNVFEVKLASDDPMPTGLAQAQNDSTMEVATKFSKFLTGAAVFNAVPVLPYWAAFPAFYSFFELDTRIGAHHQKPTSRSNYDTNDEEGDYNLMGSSNEMASGSTALIKGVTIAPIKPARIEPKTYFANERTFIQWISASILLLSVSSFMLEAGSAGDYKITAAVISLAAFGLVVYSTRLYFKRLNLLKNREPYGYFNIVNPIFLTTVVFVAIFLVWADSVKGTDFLDIFLNPFSFSDDDRRLLQKCPQDVIGTMLSIKENPSSLVVDFKRHSFLVTSDESVYIQPMNDDGSVSSKADPLIRIHQAHLQGTAIVGDQVFAVSEGPEGTELIEMAWWGARDHGNERLRVVGRWGLDADSRSQVDGFSFVPSTGSTSKGSFYINMDSSIRVYSVPARSENDQSAHPMRLKSLNMKVLNQGMTVGDKGSGDDRLSTMVTFEGVTYILKSKKNVLEAWNLTDGTFFSEIDLPATDEDNAMWTGVALERRITTTAETPNVRGGDTLSSDSLFLHLMTDKATFGGQIWSFPVLEDIKMPSGLFSVPDCQLATATASMN